MTAAQIPYIVFNSALAIASLAYLILILFPRHRWANFWVGGVIAPLILSLMNVLMVILFWFRAEPVAGNAQQFLSLDGIIQQFSNKGLLVAAWLEIIAMTLLASAWMTRKAAQTRMPYIYLFPCVLLAFVYAGFGFALFVIVASFGERWGSIAEVEDIPPVNSKPVAALPGQYAHVQHQS